MYSLLRTEVSPFINFNVNRSIEIKESVFNHFTAEMMTLLVDQYLLSDCTILNFSRPYAEQKKTLRIYNICIQSISPE